MDDAFQTARYLEQTGNRAGACDVLAAYLEDHPEDITAWTLFARLVDDVEAKVFCWQQIAYLSPDRDTPPILLSSLRILAERQRQKANQLHDRDE